MNRTSSAFCLFWALFPSLFLPRPAGAETRYVSPLGNHVPPFTAWADAATNVQSALDACSAGDVVVVSNGVYVLAATVRVTNDVALTALHGRDTVLFDGSALPPAADAVFLQFGTLDGVTISNAPRHGVKCESGAILNSRVVHSGQSGIDSYTAPRLVTNSTLLVTNTLVANSGSNGIYTCAVDTRILGCFVAQSAGSGVSLRQNDTVAPLTVPRVSNFLIRASTVSGNGNSGISLAFWNYNAALPTVPVRIEECVVEDNVGTRGGGIADCGGEWENRQSGVQISQTVVRRNRARVYGGGVYFLSQRNPSIRHSIVENNAADDLGGGIYLYSGTAHNCLIRNNGCANDGGGIWSLLGTGINNTIVNNRARRGGGTSGGTIQSSIVFYNQASSFPNVHGGSVAFSCSDPPVSGSGNVAGPPAFAGYDNWRLVPLSPCIDAGSFDAAAGDYDLDGEPRIWGGGIDMGCDEFYPPGLGGPLAVVVAADADRAVIGTPVSFQCDVAGRPEAYVWTFTDGYSVSNTPFVERSFTTPGIYTATVAATNGDGTASNSVTVEIFPGYTNYVAAAGLHVFPFTNRPAAATQLQDAVEANIPGGVVRVADGTYDQGGSAVDGGPTNRIAVRKAVLVISENGPSNTLILGQGPCGESAIRCAWLGAGASLSGFTLANGHTRTTGDEDRDQSGGGAWLEDGGILENCIVRDNVAARFGGGVRGGDVWNSTLRDNAAVNGGGSFDARLSRCVVSGNAASGMGGGACGGTLENCLVHGNQAEMGGGGASNRLMHSTVAGNRATLSGGGIYRGFATNSILYFNEAGSDWPNYFNSICRHCCTTPDPQTSGNVLGDPLFADVAGEDFQLLENSPAIDAAMATDLNVDLPGMHRPLLGIPGGVPAADMGAYEHLHATADTDGDGLGDRDEMDNHHTDFLLPDTDGDRHPDGAEIIAGMDPLDPDSVFAITRLIWEKTGQTLLWPGRAGRLYTVVAADGLPGIWTNRAEFTDQPGSDGTMQFTNAPLDPLHLFGVRVRLAP